MTLRDRRIVNTRAYAKLLMLLAGLAPAQAFARPAPGGPRTGNATHTPTYTTWLSDFEAVPVAHAQAFSLTEPVIPIEINGHAVHALIDTRLRAPIEMIVIQAPRALAHFVERLGLKAPTPEPSAGADAGDADGNPRWLANSVRVGPMELHDFVIVAKATDRIPLGIYITSSLLRRFGEVVLGERSVAFARHGTAKCGPTVPVTFAAAHGGAGWMTFPVTVGGQRAVATLYTDSPVPIEVQASLLQSNAESASAPGSEGGHLRQGPIALAVGTRTYHAGYALLGNLGPRAEAFQVVIGNPILRAERVYLSFGDAGASICLSPREPVANAGRAGGKGARR